MYEVEDFVGCTTSTRSSLTLALHFYPARESNRSCLGKPNAVPQERDHCELLLTADELKTAELWLVYFNRAARRLPIENSQHRTCTDLSRSSCLLPPSLS